jgi:hypothetical protein
MDNTINKAILIGRSRFYTNFTLSHVNRRYMIDVYIG